MGLLRGDRADDPSSRLRRGEGDRPYGWICYERTSITS